MGNDHRQERGADHRWSLAVSWIFTLPLVADKQLDFWPAMVTSRKVVAKHWWLVFLLLLLSGVISAIGALVCCVGCFFTAPFGFLILLAAYEMMFGPVNEPQRAIPAN